MCAVLGPGNGSHYGWIRLVPRRALSTSDFAACPPQGHRRTCAAQIKCSDGPPASGVASVTDNPISSRELTRAYLSLPCRLPNMRLSTSTAGGMRQCAPHPPGYRRYLANADRHCPLRTVVLPFVLDACVIAWLSRFTGTGAHDRWPTVDQPYATETRHVQVGASQPTALPLVTKKRKNSQPSRRRRAHPSRLRIIPVRLAATPVESDTYMCLRWPT